MLDLEKLNYAERESYQRQIEKMKVKQMSVSDFKEEVTNLLFAVIRDLVEVPNKEAERNTLLKARAKNYLVMFDILTTPEKIEKAMAEAMKNLEKRVK
jgi:hypothetical protein